MQIKVEMQKKLKENNNRKTSKIPRVTILLVGVTWNDTNSQLMKVNREFDNCNYKASTSEAYALSSAVYTHRSKYNRRRAEEKELLWNHHSRRQSILDSFSPEGDELFFRLYNSNMKQRVTIRCFYALDFHNYVNC